MADLHQKLSTLQGLLPTQKKWLERLVFQLDFNPYQLIYLVGGPGSGKSTLTLAIADLLSDDFNLALLKAEAALSAATVRHHLLEQWFGHGIASDKSLLSLIGERPSEQPLALIIDQAEQLPEELWAELDELPCLVIAAAEHSDPHAELNLPLAAPSMEDGQLLLQDQGFSTLTIAERLEQADGNLHWLLNPQLANKQRKSPQSNSASFAAPMWTFTIGMAVILAVVVFWLWTERQQQSPNGLGQLTYLPEETEITPATQVQSAAVIPEKKVVEQLVNELETVKGSTAKVQGLERPADFSSTLAGERATQNVSGVTDNSPVEQQVTTSSKRTLDVNDGQSDVLEPSSNANQQPSVVNDPPVASTKAPAESSNEQQAEMILEAPVDVAERTEPVQTDKAPALAVDELDIASEAQAEQQNNPSSGRQIEQSEPDDLAALAASEQSASNITNEPSAKSTLITTAYDASKLLSLPGNQYALQLVVFSHETALANFLKTYSQLNVLTYQRQKDGKQQLVVVLAPFADAASAKAKAAVLPAPLQQGFAKSLADIHSEISTN